MASIIPSELMRLLGNYMIEGVKQMKLSRTIILSFIMAAFLVASFGCQTDQDQNPKPTRYNNTRTQNDMYQSNQVGFGMDNGYNYGYFDNQNDWGMSGTREQAPNGWNSDNLWNNGGQNNELTQRLEQRVEQLTGVNDCTVVVQDDNCYVAIDDANNNNGQTANMTNRLEEQVREICAQEGQFTNIIVSEDNTFGEGLNDIANEIRNGRPVQDFENALRDLGTNMMPMNFR